MNSRKNLPVYISAFLLFVGGLGFLVWSALSEGSVYHLNVSEALALPSGELKAARLFGVAHSDIVKMKDGLGADFSLKDLEHPEQSIPVSYRGALPDTFEAGAEVIVEGKMRGDRFAAKTLMTKCPSKYEKANRKTS